jgi:Arc/MetJ family transcription regulator
MCIRRCPVRTNIVLDDGLVREAKKLTGIKTKRALVDEALRTLVRSRKRLSLLDLEGKIRFAPGYDYKKLRIGK